MYPERVASRVLTKWTPEGECWISTYSIGSHGYAQVGWWDGDLGKQVMTTAHRVAWWAANRRPIPKGMTVDHACHRKPCVNPLHLRLLDNATNASDNGMAAFRTNVPTGRKCRRGHELVVNPSSSRPAACRECGARRKRERRAARREET